MKNSPKKGKRYAHPVALDDALAIVGDKALWERADPVRGRRSNTAKTWLRKRAVPADIVIPELLRWWRLRDDLQRIRREVEERVRQEMADLALHGREVPRALKKTVSIPEKRSTSGGRR